MSWILLFLLAPYGLPQDGAANAEIDYSKVDRKIGKQPAYIAKPLYAIFLMDAEGKRPIWGVLDKSKPSAAIHDVLYLDLNGNGDLVDEGERFVSDEVHPPNKVEPDWAVIRIGNFKVPGTDMTHTKFHVQTVMRPKGLRGSFSLVWAGKVDVSGGMGRCDQDAEWAETPAEAPVFHPHPYGVLRFCLWDVIGEDNKANDGVLAIGKPNRVRLLAGNAGRGPTSFSAVSETFLDLNRDVLRMTLIYRDREGKERRETIQVKQHC